ncbi:hypothetical protein BTVI_21896 [Pitangus sulphuratus]|nr:hypothetical protein BTVI_21896 [Pitangus sulphuratus]
MFNFFISDIDGGAECPLGIFTCDISDNEDISGLLGKESMSHEVGSDIRGVSAFTSAMISFSIPQTLLWLVRALPFKLCPPRGEWPDKGGMINVNFNIHAPHVKMMTTRFCCGVDSVKEEVLESCSGSFGKLCGSGEELVLEKVKFRNSVRKMSVIEDGNIAEVLYLIPKQSLLKQLPYLNPDDYYLCEQLFDTPEDLGTNTAIHTCYGTQLGQCSGSILPIAELVGPTVTSTIPYLATSYTSHHCSTLPIEALLVMVIFSDRIKQVLVLHISLDTEPFICINLYTVAHPQEPHHPSEKPVIHCHKCGEPCKGEVLRVQARHFHIKCFTCKVCGCDLAQGGFFIKNGEYLCTLDYQRMYGTRCNGCGEFVEGEVVTALGKTYHPSCFACTVCKRPFPPGDRVTFNGRDCLCQMCAQPMSSSPRELSASSNCAGCGRDIKNGQALLALDKQWHLGCFKCKACGKVLTGEYISKDGAPYCEKDYQVLFGVKCEACHQFITGKVLEELKPTSNATYSEFMEMKIIKEKVIGICGKLGKNKDIDLTTFNSHENTQEK